MGLRRVHIYISGRVQGVFFRAYVREKAKLLNIKGWVKNLWDGRVEAVFEGEEKNVEKLIEYCKIGPPGAIVNNIDIKEEEYRGEFDNFFISY